MDMHRFLCWMYGIGFVIVFVTLQVALNQRDEARTFKAGIGDVELACKAVSK